MTDDLIAWLGPAADDLTPEQIERVAAATAGIDALYRDQDHEPERQAALNATVRYVLGETTAVHAFREWTAALLCQREAYAALVQVYTLDRANGGNR